MLRFNKRIPRYFALCNKSVFSLTILSLFIKKPENAFLIAILRFFDFEAGKMSAFAFAVETAVAERQDEVGCDHENVGNVEKHHIA